MKNSKARTTRCRSAAATIFVCGKCLKRHKHGKEIKRALKGAMEGTSRGEGSKSRVVRTSCFGICPRRAVVVASPSLLAGGQVAIFDDASQIDDAAVQLHESLIGV